jgi:hypothetical protein
MFKTKMGRICSALIRTLKKRLFIVVYTTLQGKFVSIPIPIRKIPNQNGKGMEKGNFW